jgi:hypothetical protein
VIHGGDKEIPARYEVQALLALSHFPELTGMNDASRADQ